MPFVILAFLAGDMYLQTLSALPTNLIFYVIGFLAVGCVCYLRNIISLLLCAFVLGGCFSGWYANHLLSWTLPAEQEEKPLLITGFIAALPLKDRKQTSFLFSMDKLQGSALSSPVLIRLHWRDAIRALRVGDKWQLRVRLKRIHGVKNPGGFDIEAWAMQKGLRARGAVLVDNQNVLISHDYSRYPIEQFRQWLKEQIQLILPHTSTAHWLMALMIGERIGIPQKDWQVLRSTGTNHLMAIAGLHIGIIVGFVHVIVNWLWRRSARLLLWLPAQYASISVALLVALFYSAIAGFSLPTQRACFMLIILSALLLLRRHTNVWHVWSFALLFVLLLNPLAVLTESFWLSFGTIALIIYGMDGRLAPTGWWWRWGRVQWVIGLGLIPLSLLLFQECSLSSFIANCIAIPWLGLTILPLCFLSTLFLFVSPAVAKLLLFIAGKSLSCLWLVLSWFHHFPFSVWMHAVPNAWIFLLTVIGILMLLFPIGMPGRWLGFVWLLPLVCYQPDKPKFGEVWVRLLDVGQGLSIVVQTASHLLVYDAGMKLGDSIDMGESVVVPYLHAIAAKKIDMLVVSHGDNDHIGGVPAILRSFPVAAIKTSVPEKLALSRAHYCLAGHEWEWDGIHFKFIHPEQEDIGAGNDSSCVLHIDQKKFSVLLTGDIEKSAEQQLLQRRSRQLSATILIAPHHGSKTSGLPAFIQAVNPQYVLYAVGYKNRYRFPHPSVVTTYQQLGVQQLNTVDNGLIEFKLSKETLSYSTYRQWRHHYWSDLVNN